MFRYSSVVIRTPHHINLDSVIFAWYDSCWDFPHDKEDFGMINVTDVRVRLVKIDGGKLKGVASVVIDDCIAIHDIKLIEGEEGLFMAMPSKKIADGEYRDIVHPINSQTREILKEKVLDAYNRAFQEDLQKETATE